MQFSPLKAHATLYFTRDQQIQEVLDTFQGSTFDPQQETICVPFILPDSGPCEVVVRLCSKFPRAPPSNIQLQSRTLPPYLVSSLELKRAEARAAQSWGSSRVRLATVLRDIVNALSFGYNSPPTDTRSPSTSPARIRSSPSSPMRLPFFGGGNSAGRGDTPSRIGPSQPGDSGELGGISSSPATGTIPTPATFPQIASMSIEELESAMLNEGAFSKLLTKVSNEQRSRRCGDAAAQVATLRKDNAESARENLSKEAEIKEVRHQIAIVRSTEYEPAKAAFEQKYRRQQEAREHLAPERLIANLHEAALAAEREGIALEQRFLRGEIAAAKFVDDYVAARVKFRSREIMHLSAAETIPHDRPFNGAMSQGRVT